MTVTVDERAEPTTIADDDEPRGRPRRAGDPRRRAGGCSAGMPTERSDEVRRGRAAARATCSARSGPILVARRSSRRSPAPSSTCSGPRVLGHATDVIIDGRPAARRASTSAACTACCCLAIGLYVGVGRARRS